MTGVESHYFPRINGHPHPFPSKWLQTPATRAKSIATGIDIELCTSATCAYSFSFSPRLLGELSRQRSRVRVSSSPPYIPKDLRNAWQLQSDNPQSSVPFPLTWDRSRSNLIATVLNLSQTIPLEHKVVRLWILFLKSIFVFPIYQASTKVPATGLTPARKSDDKDSPVWESSLLCQASIRLYRSRSRCARLLRRGSHLLTRTGQGDSVDNFSLHK